MFAKVICLIVLNCTANAINSLRWRSKKRNAADAPPPHHDSDSSDSADFDLSDDENDAVQLEEPENNRPPRQRHYLIGEDQRGLVQECFAAIVSMANKALNVYNVHHYYLDHDGIRTSESTFLRALKRFQASYADHDKGNAYRRARSTANNLRYLMYYLKKLIELLTDITQSVIFVDETWIVANMHRKKFWAMLVGDTIVSRDYKPGKGGRGIVVGALARFGCTEENAEPWFGMVPNASKIWDPSPNRPYVFAKPDSPPRCKDKQDMNSAMFLDWVKDCLLPNIPDGSHIVLDHARYHTFVHPGDKIPKMSSKLEDIRAWILAHTSRTLAADKKYREGLYERGVFKSHLLERVAEIVEAKGLAAQRAVEKVLAENGRGHKVLWLPIAYCEFNPIELVWAQLKRHLQESNVSCSLVKLIEQGTTFLNAFSAARAEMVIKHVYDAAIAYVEDHPEAEAGADGDPDIDDDGEEENVDE